MVADRLSLLLLFLGGCARPATIADRDPTTSTTPRTPTASVARDGPAVTWSQFTQSPNPGTVAPELLELLEECGEFDATLGAAAAWVTSRGPLGQTDDELEQLTFALRAFGSPYVRPAAWTRAAQAGVDAIPASGTSARQDLRVWLRTQESSRFRRCGVAQGEWQGNSLTAVVVSSALADMVKPLPTQARVGQWLELLAELRVESNAAKVVLLGPDGDPKTVPTEKSGNRVRARFPAAMPGRWLVQVVADLNGGGPRQVLEALLFVDETPPATYQPQNAPGERPSRLNESADAALYEMLGALRVRARRPRLQRDARLDRAALTHAESMRRAGRIGHDIGDGSTADRLAAIDFTSRLAGENVAHATDALHVHRALWASPSHRSNLLNRSFSRFGLGVVEDSDHSLWVCELFASED